MKYESLATDLHAANALAWTARGKPKRCTWPGDFVAQKRALDFLCAVLAFPLIVIVGAGLLLMNPVANPGPLFFSQYRMGRDGRRFRMWKFRTMRPARSGQRRYDDPLEEDRVSPLGRFLRSSRIDELPNFVNVFTGDMSLIGPRPDVWEHATVYLKIVPHYADRFSVRPGITGLAQVRNGYADTMAVVRRKALLDSIYVRHASWAVERSIVLATIRVLLTRHGAK